MSTQPGWYNQPDGSQRYWNGQAWTEHVRPMQALPTAPAGGGVGPESGGPTSGTPLYKNKFVIGGAAVVLVAAMMASLAGGGEQQAAAPTAVPTATVTVTESVAAEPTTPAPEPTISEAERPPSTQPEEAEVSSEPEPEAEPETFTMPRLVGKNLQDAQDLLQSLGSYLMDQQDASGLGRIQVRDSNWKVCRQRPAAGTVVPVDTVVILAAVKLDERCP